MIHSINLCNLIWIEIYFKIIYLNRYENKPPQIAFIHGIGLKKGAFASSISHDSHNIIAVGCNDQDLLIALNSIISAKGGDFQWHLREKLTFYLYLLPVLLTDENGEKVGMIWNKLIQILRHVMGVYSIHLL